MDNALHEPQHILVLGGTSDIALAIVRELLSPATRTVVLACRDLEAGEQAAAGLRHGSLTVDVVAFEAGSPATHEDVVADVAARHGDIDVAIVAFALLGDGEATSRDVAEATRLADVNFTGSVSALVALGNRMRVQGHGAIVVLSSVAGERVRKANAVYGATKAGLDVMVKSLARVLGPEIRLIAVSPGAVDTNFVPGRGAEFNAKAAAANPLKRIATPEDCARAILACATHLTYTTGVKIVVDGGRSL